MPLRFHFPDAYGEGPEALWQAVESACLAAAALLSGILPTDRLDVVVAPSAWVVLKLAMGPSFSLPNQVDQMRAMAYHACAGSDSPRLPLVSECSAIG